MRSELTKLRGVIFYKVLEDLHAHLYNKGDYRYLISSCSSFFSLTSSFTCVFMHYDGVTGHLYFSSCWLRYMLLFFNAILMYITVR